MSNVVSMKGPVTKFYLYDKSFFKTTLMFWLISPEMDSPQYSVDRKVCKPQTESGHSGNEKIPPFLIEIETWSPSSKTKLELTSITGHYLRIHNQNTLKQPAGPGFTWV
jgi:hypothetical protein